MELKELSEHIKSHFSTQLGQVACLSASEDNSRFLIAFTITENKRWKMLKVMRDVTNEIGNFLGKTYYSVECSIITVREYKPDNVLIYVFSTMKGGMVMVDSETILPKDLYVYFSPKPFI